MQVEGVVAVAVQQIEAAHQSREQALASSRALTRQCANTIRAVHRGQYDTAATLLGEAATTARMLQDRLVAQPSLLFAGYTQDALKEYAEAALVYAFLHGDALPSPTDLGVEAPAYLNGLAEAASELRRAILDDLRHGRLDRIEPLLTVMDDVYSLLITIDFPDAVTGGLRRTTDALRAVLERTRGDVTTALRQEAFAASLQQLATSLPPLPTPE